MVTFGAETDVTNERVFNRSSHKDVFFKKSGL